jgi:hypothetical protein
MNKEITGWVATVALMLALASTIWLAVNKPDDGIKPPKTQAFEVTTPHGEVYECWMYENIVTCDYPGE